MVEKALEQGPEPRQYGEVAPSRVDDVPAGTDSNGGSVPHNHVHHGDGASGHRAARTDNRWVCYYDDDVQTI